MTDLHTLKFLFSSFRILVVLLAMAMAVVAMLVDSEIIAAVCMAMAMLTVVFGIGFSLVRLAVSLGAVRAEMDLARKQRGYDEQRLAILEAMFASVGPSVALGAREAAANLPSAQAEHEEALVARVERIIAKQGVVIDHILSEVETLSARTDFALDTSTVQRMDMADIRQDIHHMRVAREAEVAQQVPGDGARS